MVKPRGLRHDKTGRSSTEHLRKFKPKNRPAECGCERFGWIPLEMMESEAFRALSVNSRRLLDRILIEHIHQGGLENGQLVVTHDQFRDHGVTSTCVKEAISECVAYGFIRVKLGGKKANSNQPNRYTLTWLGSIGDDERPRDPSNAWKGTTPEFVAAWQVKRKSKRTISRRYEAAKRAKRKAAQNSEVTP